MNLPNKLTAARCVMAMVFMILMTVEHPITYFIAFWCFIAAVITDHYDGRIARERNLVTNFGKLMDPVADKVLMGAGYLALVTIPEMRLPAWTVVVILAREFLITGLRSLAAAEGVIIPADKYGKLKTIFQMTYVGVFMFMAFFLELLQWWPALEAVMPGGYAPYAAVIGWASLVSVLFVTGYTVYSGYAFIRGNWERLHLAE